MFKLKFLSKLKEIIPRRPLYVQVLFTLIAFLAIAVLSYFFMGDIVHGYLLQNVESVFSVTQVQIESIQQEHRVNLNGLARTVRNMILRGDDINKLQDYFDDISDYVFFNNRDTSSFIGLFGNFGTFSDVPVLAEGLRWNLPDNFVPEEHSWYQNAVAANGDIAETLVYEDTVFGNKVAVFIHALSVFDDKGRMLGVVGQGCRMRDIGEVVVETAQAQGGYGILLSEDLIVLAHPVKGFIGGPLNNPTVPASIFVDDLLKGKEIFKRPVISFRNEKSVAFFRKLPNGLYLGLITPKDKYYHDVVNMALIIGMLSVVFAAALIYVLIRIDAAKSKSDMENRHKSDFLAAMSHEIRTPMNAILGITEILLGNENLSPDTMEAVAKIYSSGDLLLGIINDILDFSKIESGKLDLTPVRYNVASMINDTVHLNKIKYESKPINFRLLVDETIPSVLVGDELRIRQILNNLLSNAYKYTQSGEIELSVKVEYDAKTERKREASAVNTGDITLVFRIRDTGQGMTNEQIGILFDKYERFNIDANRMIEGAGLGMSITWNLVQMMKGDISVESIPDKGSIVTVRLRQESVGAEALGRAVTENLQQFRLSHALQIKRTKVLREPMPYGSVLIVDDTETNLYVAKGLMLHYKLKIDTASSGEEAIEKIKNGNKYDIVFMDHMMPGLGGMETTKILRRMGYPYAIVALTANAVVGQAAVFLKNGFDGFISKPIDLHQLNATLNRFIRDKQSPEVVEAARRLCRVNDKDFANSAPDIDPQLAESFVRDAVKVIDDIESILKNKTANLDEKFNKYVISLHGIKSVLIGIGEDACFRSALHLEQAGRRRDMAVITTETPAFLNNLKAIISRNKPVNGASSDLNECAADDDLPYVRKKLLAIKEACRAYDIKTAEAELTGLKQKTQLLQTRELLDSIAVHLLHSEFDEAVDIIDRNI